MKRKILSILVCLCMALSLLPTSALADTAPTTAPTLYVGGVEVASPKTVTTETSVTGPGITGTVNYRYNSSDSMGVLTLSGASITGAHTDDSNNTYGIYAVGIDLTIELEGVNTVIGADSGASSYGIFGESNVTVTGNGSLNAVGGKADNSYGLFGTSGVVISDSAAVTAAGGEASATSCGICGNGTIAISDSAKIVATGDSGNDSYGMESANGGSVSISITGGTVTSTGGKATASSCGLLGNGTITVTGGTVTATGGKGTSSYGVYGSTITVNSEIGGGLLIAKGKTSAANTAPTCGDGSAALIGTESTNFAAWGVGETYPAANILSSTLDLNTWNDDTTSYWSETSGGYKTETVEGVKTLTLKNVIISSLDNDRNNTYGIRLPDAAVRVVLEGVNIVSAGNSSGSGSASNSYGIYGDSSITFSGDGTLCALSGTSSYGYSYGVCGSGAITFSSSTVTAISSTAESYGYGVCGGSVTVSGGTVTAIGGASGQYSYGMHGGSVTVTNDASVTATAIGAASCNYGVYSPGSISVADGATVTAAGGSTRLSYGVYGSSVIVTDSASVTATSGTATDEYGYSCGVYGGTMYGGSGTITVTGGTVTATGGSATGGHGYSCGVYSYGDSGTISLSGSVTATGGSANNNSCGVYGNSITVSGGTVTATGGAAGSNSYGLYGSSIILSGGTVTVTGGSASNSYGVYGSGVSIYGGTVIAAGGTAGSDSGGVYGSSSVTISHGTVTATGGKASRYSYGVYGSSSVTVETAGAVTAVGGSSDVYSYGVCSNSSVTLSGSVAATGGSASSGSFGVYSYSASSTSTVTLSGIVTATGGAAGSSYGVYNQSNNSTGSSTFSGSVTATGGTASSNSYGIYNNGISIVSTINLSGTVTATGGAANNSYGIYGNKNNFAGDSVSVTGGMTTATGGSASTVSCGVYSFSGNISVKGGTAAAISRTATSGSSLAMNKAPNYSSYTGAGVIASTSADGASPSTSYDANSITTYKYLKIGTLYALTINLNGGSGSTASSNRMAGDVVSIDAGMKSGYTFSGWTQEGGGTFANTSSASTTYTMPAGAAAIAATWTANPTGGGDTGTSTSTAVSVSIGSETVSLSASVSGSTATVSATDAQLQKITSGMETGTVKIDASDLKVDTVVVSSKLITAAVDVSGSAGFSVALPTGTVSLDKTALASVADQGDIKLSVEIVQNSTLTDTQKEVLGEQAGTALVVDVNVYVSGTRTSTFGNGKISVSIPYTPRPSENTDSVTVWFIKDDGTIEPKSGVYNASTGCVEFTTGHLSQYLIVSFPFTDVTEDSWYYGSVAYAYNNGLFSGTSATSFSPDMAMTRQMIWMVLARMDGKTLADIDAARSWAMENGISDGSNPKDSITREQMATILYRYAQYKGYDTTQGGMAIREFTDFDSISNYALTALGWSVNAGLMQGSNNNLMPLGSATRAQAATILQRFCQNVVK